MQVLRYQKELALILILKTHLHHQHILCVERRLLHHVKFTTLLTTSPVASQLIKVCLTELSRNPSCWRKRIGGFALKTLKAEGDTFDFHFYRWCS
jgi:hypothetical protein